MCASIIEYCYRLVCVCAAVDIAAPQLRWPFHSLSLSRSKFEKKKREVAKKVELATVDHGAQVAHSREKSDVFEWQ